MATSQRDLSATVLGGSDELFDFCCQPCSTENLNMEAAGFCQQCHEYLCDDCCKYHRKSTTSRHHKVLDKAAMPRSSIAPRVTDTLTETCGKHAGKVLEYFCNGHGEICCSVCLNLNHSSCKKKSYIPDISNGASTIKDYKELIEKLDRLVAMATIEQTQVKLNDKYNDECHTKALADIKQCRQELDKLLDKAVDEAVQNVTRLHKANADGIKTAEHSCQSVLSDVAAITTDLEKKMKASKNNQLFVGIKLARHRLPAIEKEIQDATDRDLTHYKFDKDEKVQELRSALSAMFTLSVRKVGAEANARYVQEVNVKSAEDKKDCLIEGIAVVAGDRLVAGDPNNVAVKLVDVRQNSVISRLPMSSLPFDVIRTAPTTVAVALGQEEKIEILTVSDVLTRGHTINVSGLKFSSMCYINDRDRFVVLSEGKRVVKIVDMSGRVLTTVYQDNNTDPLFKCPRYIALNHSHDVIYISDYKANTVTTMTMKGDVISVYRHAQLKCPVGVAVGRDGVVYVCSRDTHTVHQLSARGQHGKVVLDQQRGLTIFPSSIAYDEDGSSLWVSSASTRPEDRNHVRLFQLE